MVQVVATLLLTATALVRPHYELVGGIVDIGTGKVVYAQRLSKVDYPTQEACIADGDKVTIPPHQDGDKYLLVIACVKAGPHELVTDI